MRVAFVTERTAFQASTEGRERLRRVGRGLADRGHDVTVYCTRWWPGDDEFHDHEGVTYRAVTVDPARTAFLSRVPVLLALDRPDVVHAAPAPPAQVDAAHVGGALARAPLVVEWFGDEGLTATRATRRAASTPALVVTPSELVRTVVRELGASEETTAVVPESIDTALIESVSPGDGADIVYARRLDADANLETLLLGLAELRDRDWSATVVGDGPERERYERQARDLRIDERVTFAGDLPRRERVAVYRGAHVFVQTAYRENFATELLWALSCGCVGVVQYQAESSAHELIETYDRSVRVSDDEELATALTDATRHERRIRDPAMDRYDHEAILDRYREMYDRLRDEQGVF